MMLVKIAKKKKLNGIAITDHNTTKGAVQVRRICRKVKGVDFVFGEEILTDIGEVLAYYITEEIKPGKILTVLDKIKEQGGLASFAHPYSVGIIRKSSRPDPDDKYIKKVLKKINGVETFNSRTTIMANNRARRFAKETGLAETGGSDSHFNWEIGLAYTIFRNNLKKEILQKKTRSGGKNTLFWLGRINSFFAKSFRL
jgi:predicted metal-dependent phosphoesterase TrpH